MGAVVDGLVRLLGRLGGRVRCNAPVEEILVTHRQAHGVRTAGRGDPLPEPMLAVIEQAGAGFG